MNHVEITISIGGVTGRVITSIFIQVVLPAMLIQVH
jgi:hypothetical protein